jgi:hypothetical protein
MEGEKQTRSEDRTEVRPAERCRTVQVSERQGQAGPGQNNEQAPKPKASRARMASAHPSVPGPVIVAVTGTVPDPAGRPC